MYNGKYITQSDVIVRVRELTKQWQSACSMNDGYWEKEEACKMMDEIAGLIHHLNWSQTFDPNQPGSLPNWDKKLVVIK